MTTRFSRRSTRVQHKPHVCISTPKGPRFIPSSPAGIAALDFVANFPSGINTFNGTTDQFFFIGADTWRSLILTDEGNVGFIDIIWLGSGGEIILTVSFTGGGTSPIAGTSGATDPGSRPWTTPIFDLIDGHPQVAGTAQVTLNSNWPPP